MIQLVEMMQDSLASVIAYCDVAPINKTPLFYAILCLYLLTVLVWLFTFHSRHKTKTFYPRFYLHKINFRFVLIRLTNSLQNRIHSSAKQCDSNAWLVEKIFCEIKIKRTKLRLFLICHFNSNYLRMQYTLWVIITSNLYATCGLKINTAISSYLWW